MPMSRAVRPGTPRRLRARHDDVAAVGVQEAGDDVQQRGLAAARGARACARHSPSPTSNVTPSSAATAPKRLATPRTDRKRHPGALRQAREQAVEALDPVVELAADPRTTSVGRRRRQRLVGIETEALLERPRAARPPKLTGATALSAAIWVCTSLPIMWFRQRASRAIGFLAPLVGAMQFRPARISRPPLAIAKPIGEPCLARRWARSADET